MGTRRIAQMGRCDGCQRQAVLIRCERLRQVGGRLLGEEVMACERCVNIWGAMGQLAGAPADPSVLQGPMGEAGAIDGPEPVRARRSTTIGVTFCPVCNGTQWRCHVCGTPTQIDTSGDCEVCPVCKDPAGRPLAQAPAEHGWESGRRSEGHGT